MSRASETSIKEMRVPVSQKCLASCMGVVGAAGRMGPQGGNLVIREYTSVYKSTNTYRKMAKSEDDSMAGL